MLEDINLLISKLDWNMPTNSQQDAIEQLLNIDDLHIMLLVQPMEKKYWENSAKVLKLIGYPRNKLAIPGLLKWLQDLNWPGAWIAMEILEGLDKKILMPYFEIAFKEAVEEDDEMWMMALKELALIRLSVDSSDFSNQEFYNILQ